MNFFVPPWKKPPEMIVIGSKEPGNGFRKIRYGRPLVYFFQKTEFFSQKGMKYKRYPFLLKEDYP